jgi:hypothetical protein
VKTSKNDQNFEFRLISYFENFKKWPKLREMMKTSRKAEMAEAAPKLQEMTKTSRRGPLAGAPKGGRGPWAALAPALSRSFLSS